MDVFESYEHNKLTVEIINDTDPLNPREDWDNAGVMICSHRRYTLGDEQFDPEYFEGWADLEKHLRKERNAVIVLPLGLYDHSGITMYVGDTHDYWDGGQVGFIYIDKETVDKEWGGDLEKAEQCLRGEVQTYNQYLTGDVWGYRIINPKNDEEVDSCWGFFGLEYAKEEAESVADHFEHPHDAAYAKNARIIHG